MRDTYSSACYRSTSHQIRRRQAHNDTDDYRIHIHPATTISDLPRVKTPIPLAKICLSQRKKVIKGSTLIRLSQTGSMIFAYPICPISLSVPSAAEDILPPHFPARL